MAADASESSVRDGVHAGLPLVLPIFAVAVSFGVLARPVLGALPAVVMSIVVFAGAAQFASLSVLAAGGAAGAAIVAGLLMNARFLPMGFAVAPSLRGRSFARAAQGQAIVDASWALASRRDGTFDRGLLLGATIPQAFAWISGTIVGVFAGASLAHPERFGLDAIFPAFYLALLVGELRTDRSRIAAALGAVIAFALIPVAPAGVPVIAASAAALIGLRRR
ncbi:MAG: AzlC family ABC transporter permease [Gaiellaceae bacterium]|jgi:predicted branched-subunit amino acid permease